MKKILTFSGSARKGSFNSALLAELERALAAHATVEHVDFSNVPLYNQDLEAAFPQAVTDLKTKIRAADGIVIATPEYNRSIPGYLKNMVDWTSRPYGDNAWAGKPVFVTGAGGPVGTALAQYDLKKVMLYLNAKVMGQPELHVSHLHLKFNTDMATYSTDGTIIDEEFKAQIAKDSAAFLGYIG